MSKEKLAEELAYYIYHQDFDVMDNPETLTEVILQYLKVYA